MTTITIQIQGTDKLLAKLGRLQTNNMLRRPMEASLIEIETWMKAYPARQSTKQNPGQFVSERQRRYVMAAIRRGTIKIPYTRTGKLGQRWTRRIADRGSGIVGTVGNNIRYAIFVQSAERQARMHQGNWRTDAQAITRFRPSIEARFKAAIDAEIRKP